ncbi:MAG: arylsulfatase, partial [Planctomycetaceae bacterium]
MTELSGRLQRLPFMDHLGMAPFLLFVTCAICDRTGQPASADVQTPRPNIVVILTDDQGYGDASCLAEAAKFRTPHIDRLSHKGLTFLDGHSSDTVCTPSRYGLLTGRYSWRTHLKRGVMQAEGDCLISQGRLTLASMLAAQGYQTAMVGKWHLGMDFPGTRGNRDWSQPVRDMPLDKGFDFYWGIPASMNYGVLAWFEGRFAKQPPTLFTRKKPNAAALSDYRIMPPYQAKPSRPDDLEVAADFVDSQCLTRFTDVALDWIRGRASDARDGKPFFVYLPYTSPHKPVITIEKFRGASQAGAYGDFMMETDWHVGRILKLLDQEQLTNNTIVVLTSDNGPENTWKQRATLYGHRRSGPYREGKRSIYEGGHRVPFLVHWPDKVRSGRTWSQPVCQTDLLATFAEMLDVKLPHTAAEDSVSFLDVLLDKPNIPARASMVHHSARGRFAVRSGHWKLVMETSKLKRELYNLQTDPA